MSTNPKPGIVTKEIRGVLHYQPSSMYPSIMVPLDLNDQVLRDMSMGELLDAMKACFYSEPGGTDTRRCAKLLAEIHDRFKHSAY